MEATMSEMSWFFLSQRVYSEGKNLLLRSKFFAESQKKVTKIEPFKKKNAENPPSLSLLL